jgi:hypothetical protein
MSSEQTRQQVRELHNLMLMSPQDFSFRWGIGYEELADICAISKSTTYHWLGGQASRRQAGLPYQRIMAVADLLLENAEQVYPMLERWQTRRQEH